MNKTIKVATCPCCTAPVPLDSGGAWIRHDDTKGLATYECPGSGEVPHERNVQSITCSDGPVSP